MNKRELKKWIKEQRNEAKSTLHKDYQKATEQYKQSLVESTGLDTMLDKLLKSDVVKEYVSWRGEHEKDLKLTGWNYSSGLDSNLIFLDQHTLKEITERFLFNSSNWRDLPKYIELSRSYNKAKMEVDRNYDNLIHNIIVCKTAKEAIAYLKGLGFKVPEDNSVVTAIAVSIDTRFLMLPKSE